MSVQLAVAQQLIGTQRPKSYSAGVRQFTVAATPTDVFALICQDFFNAVKLRRIRVDGIADTAATVDVLLQRSANGGGGTSTNLSPTRHDLRDVTPTGLTFAFTANRSSGGDGISASRPLIRKGEMTFATSSTAGVAVEFSFVGDKKPPTIQDLISWLVINLAGQTMPANAKLSITCEWEEDRVARVAMCGDSTYSHATSLFSALGMGGALDGYSSIDNLGSNGFRLTDFLNNTNGVTYPLATSTSRIQDVVVLGYGLNDIRQGLVSQAELIALLESTIVAILAAAPDNKIILHGPNTVCTDDPTASGFVSLSGLFAGMTLAVAAQTISDICYTAYESFRNDARIFAVIQRQDVTGRTSRTVAASGIYTDQGHPNARGQTLIARQIAPVIGAAAVATRALVAI